MKISLYYNCLKRKHTHYLLFCRYQIANNAKENKMDLNLLVKILAKIDMTETILNVVNSLKPKITETYKEEWVNYEDSWQRPEMKNLCCYWEKSPEIFEDEKRERVKSSSTDSGFVDYESYEKQMQLMIDRLSSDDEEKLEKITIDNEKTSIDSNDEIFDNISSADESESESMEFGTYEFFLNFKKFFDMDQPKFPIEPLTQLTKVAYPYQKEKKDMVEPKVCKTIIELCVQIKYKRQTIVYLLTIRII